MIWFILPAVVALGLMLAVSWLGSSKGKGKLGEFVVSSRLKELGPGHDILNDLTFVIDGESTQIDHVVLSTRGVFVIETKNYQGKIFGKAHEPQWTQRLGRQSFKFQNPLRQNYRHRKFLAEKCGVKEEAIVPLVVFTGNADFPKGMPEGVFYPKALVKAIRETTDAKLNNAQVHTIKRTLEELGATTRDKTAIHLGNLKARHG